MRLNLSKILIPWYESVIRHILFVTMTCGLQILICCKVQPFELHGASTKKNDRLIQTVIFLYKIFIIEYPVSVLRGALHRGFR